MNRLKLTGVCALGLIVTDPVGAAGPLGYRSPVTRSVVACPPCPPAPRYSSPYAPIVPPVPFPAPPGSNFNPNLNPYSPQMPGSLPTPATPPGTLPNPNTPPGTGATNPLPPIPNPTPDASSPSANRPALDSGSGLLAEAPARGTGSGGSLLPTVMGDMLGGGGIAGPLPAFLTPDGRYAGIPPVFVLPSGETVRSIVPNQPPIDELLRARTAGTNLVPYIPNPLATVPPGSVRTLVSPPPGYVFDQSLAPYVMRIPQVVRGAFKVTENDTPRPTTRLYKSYYFYDQVYKGFSGPLAPRMRLHQEVLGYEKAFFDGRASVGIRVPFYQLTTAGGRDQNGIADLTFVSKVALYDNRETGSLISTGLLVTVPTGSHSMRNSLTGDRIGGTLLQPFVGYIYRLPEWYIQGFSSIVVPTDKNDTTFIANDFQIGYDLYRAPGQKLSAIIPTFEAHINTPLTNRGAKYDPVGFVDTVTLLGGTQFLFSDKAGLGIGTGAPITGPRPFSLQVSVQFNLWF